MPTDLKLLIESTHHCRATKIEARLARIESHGEPYERHIETFRLSDHSTGKIAYAWEALGDGTRKEPNTTIVIASGAINSPESALKKVADDMFQSIIDKL